MNTVNPNNFNDTLKGYIVRALREAEIDSESRQKVLNALSWALSEMTMQDARREYEQYRQGLIRLAGDE